MNNDTGSFSSGTQSITDGTQSITSDAGSVTWDPAVPDKRLEELGSGHTIAAADLFHGLRVSNKLARYQKQQSWDVEPPFTLQEVMSLMICFPVRVGVGQINPFGL